MRNKTKIFPFVIFSMLFALNVVKAQDNLLLRKNRIYVEAVGNNFADPNSSADAGVISINYCRKVIIKHTSLMFSAGIGPVKATGYDSVKRTATNITCLNIPTGILWRHNYKRNGLWAGIFFTVYLGKISYISLNQPYKFSFQISPNISYEFQSKSEKLFLRLNYTPKLLGYCFSEKYSNPFSSQPKFILFWGGISIGGGW